MSITLYTVKEISQIIHSNPSYVYDLIRKGFLPAMKLGSYKVREEALKMFLLEAEGKDLTDLDDVKELPKINDGGDHNWLKSHV
ncbi:helix-turn-helix domain-containing protein [Massiliimalia massiliensis]|uniref:helix-turn-helix domain-containing protein n=1 Tax=Massiliimalia massiliensis TaxID=1852384 RepID=UPI0009852309|nr:helix-turn-helix domain-containing protein [Massiliimalia massiliensis]